MKQQKRQGHVAVDNLGRELPTNYEGHEFHNPYDVFIPGKSYPFDENVTYLQPRVEQTVQKELFGHQSLFDKEGLPTKESIELIKSDNENIRRQLIEFGATIQDEKEKDYYFKTFTAEGDVSVEDEDVDTSADAETTKMLQKLGTTDVDAALAATDTVTNFFAYSFKYGSPQVKAQFIAAAATVFLSTAVLGYEGVAACDQYFYDLQHPLHGH
eukprot:UN00089